MTWVVCGSATPFSLDRATHPALPVRHAPWRAVAPPPSLSAWPFLAVGVHPPMLHLNLGDRTARTDMHLGAIGDRSPVPPVMERDVTQEDAQDVPWCPAVGPHASPPVVPELPPRPHPALQMIAHTTAGWHAFLHDQRVMLLVWDFARVVFVPLLLPQEAVNGLP